MKLTHSNATYQVQNPHSNARVKEVHENEESYLYEVNAGLLIYKFQRYWLRGLVCRSVCWQNDPGLAEAPVSRSSAQKLQ